MTKPIPSAPCKQEMLVDDPIGKPCRYQFETNDPSTDDKKLFGHRLERKGPVEVTTFSSSI